MPWKYDHLKFHIATFQASKYNNEASARDTVNDQQEQKIPRRGRMMVFMWMNVLDTIWNTTTNEHLCNNSQYICLDAPF